MIPVILLFYDLICSALIVWMGKLVGISCFFVFTFLYFFSVLNICSKQYVATPCPAKSSGMNVAVGCACNTGFSGAVEPATIEPFFNSSCKGTWYHSILNAVLAQCTVIHNYIVCSDQCFPCIDSNCMSFSF